MARATSSPAFITIEKVLSDELTQVDDSRKLRLGSDCPSATTKDNLIGLAFSGGGIRSATFNLGILQALARARLLRTFDYLSTVSGGGYIGAWLMAWMHHQQIGIADIEARLSQPPLDGHESGDIPEVRFLRDYSDYLTPKKDLLGGDFWAFVASYLRNTLLNQAILVLALLSVLLAPRTFVYVLHLLESLEEVLQARLSGSMQRLAVSQNLALVLGIAFAAVAVTFIGFNLVSVELRGRATRDTADSWYTRSGAVHTVIVVPLLLSAALLAYAIGASYGDWTGWGFPDVSGPILFCVLYFGLWSFALLVQILATRKGFKLSSIALILATAAISGMITGFLFIPVASILVTGGDTFKIWRGMTFGAPLMIGMMLIAGVLHIGLIGRGMPDAQREWWGRLGGMLMIHAIAWYGLFLIALYFPYAVGSAKITWVQVLIRKAASGSGLVWLASAGYAVFGKSGLSGLDAESQQKLKHYLRVSVPYVFIAYVLLYLSVVASAFCAWIAGHGETVTRFPSDWYFSPTVPVACIGLFGAAMILSWRVDINEFSTHYLYRNRLVRCYMGASAPKRHSQPFTGFSERDNFALSELAIPAQSQASKDGRPLPIVNTSLNVVRGEELAVQTRTARSFAFTPLYGGFTRQKPESRDWEPFFGLTRDAHSERAPSGISLGTVIAISGTAASPNVGSYSGRSLAFLMTLFGVRRGWWMGNPASRWWNRAGPVFGFGCLIAELLGNANDKGNFLYLTDGGHFENLAIYELVRRKCMLIVASDASCDGNCTLADLHNAMERCRADFGVNIAFENENPLRPVGQDGLPLSQVHFLKGEIEYPGTTEKGVIIYIKSTVTSDDPKDVLAYADANHHFPHDTIADQRFDETLFENYQALGEAAGNSAVEKIAAASVELIGYPKSARVKTAAT